MTPTAIAFDLYGTLLDYGSLSERITAPGVDPVQFVAAWRAKQLSYALTATMMDRYVDFDTLTRHALDYTAAQLGANLSADERAALAGAWATLPAHPDVASALAALRARGSRLVVLSNGTPTSIASAVDAAGIAGYFDALLSVEAVGAYKPRPEVYHLAVEHFQLSRAQIGFVSSNGWDATGATEFGFTVFWCNRSGAPAETFGAKPAHAIANLGELLTGG